MKHPKAVIKKADGVYYKKDITEEVVWNYYDAMKKVIFPYLKDKVIFIVLKLRFAPIYMRHPFGKGNGLIVLKDTKNFDHYNTGRVLEFHITAEKKEDIFVLDIDPDRNIIWTDLKASVKKICDAVKKIGIGKIKIYYTGKRSFQIWCFMEKKERIEKIKREWEEKLKKYFEFDSMIDVALVQPKKNRINIDFSPLKYNGGHVAPFSMRALTGLVCVEVSSADISQFEKREATIEKVFEKTLKKKFKW